MATMQEQGFAERVARWVGAIVISIVLLGGESQKAEAKKLVGVVFDDSGSMAGRTNLPVFGIQMLAASLTSEDRLYGIRFSQFQAAAGRGPFRLDKQTLERFLTQYPIGSAPEARQSISKIRSWARQAPAGTPFMPVEVMLAYLSQVAEAGDDVHLFVFTDGQFTNGVDRASEASFLRYKAAFGNKVRSVTTHFLAFAERGVRKKIQDQGVAEKLLKVFNGNANLDREVFVDNFNDLYRRLVEKVALIADTPIEENPAIKSRLSDRFKVNPPFTVSKLVIIATGTDKVAPASIAQLPNGSLSPVEFEALMERPDQVRKAGKGADVRRRAKIWHIEPNPALPAGTPFEVVFNRPLSQGESLLFRSNVTVQWSIHDGSGAVVVPDPNGVITLASEEDYQVRAHVEDKDAGTGKPADLSKLNSDAFTLRRRDGSSRNIRQAMAIDTAKNIATATLNYKKPRAPEEVAVILSIPGFITSRSKKLKIRVVKSDVKIKLNSEPSKSCAKCGPQRAEPIVKQGGVFTPAMSVTTQFESTSTLTRGRVTFSLGEPLPKGLRATVASTGQVLSGADVKFEKRYQVGDTIRLEFEVDSQLLSTLPNGHTVVLNVKSDDRLIGFASTVFEIVPKAPVPTIEFAGNTDGQSGGTPLEVRPDGLVGKTGFFVRVTDAYKPAFDNFKVTVAGLKTEIVDDGKNGRQILVKPRPNWWCNCFVQSGHYPIEVTYINKFGGNPAALKGKFIISELSWTERFFVCLSLLLSVLAAAYLIAGITRFVITNRFPRSSRFLTYEKGHRQDAEVRRMKNGWAPWIGPFLIPFRNWNAKGTLQGLSLAAGRNLVYLLPKKSGYDFVRRVAERRTLSASFPDGSTEPLELLWGDQLQETTGDKRIFEFLESRRDF